MFTLAGTLVGFVAMLIGRGHFGAAVGAAFLGFVLGVVSSIVFGFEMVNNIFDSGQSPEALLDIDWSQSDLIAFAFAAGPGVLGAIFTRRFS